MTQHAISILESLRGVANGRAGARRIGRWALLLSMCVMCAAQSVTITEYHAAGGSTPYGITTGTDGALWFGELGTNKIGRITTTGTITQFNIPTTNAVPDAITAGPDGALWFAEQQANKIGRITTGGVITEYTIPTAGSYPNAITAGPDGNLWFTENSGLNVARIGTNGTITEYQSPSTGSPGPGFITKGPDGALWFTAARDNYIGRITTSGTITSFALPVNTNPNGIAAGPDGALWFAQAGSNQIGRITATGTITEYNIPTVGSGAFDIITGPDGALWFTETTANNIGRITTTGTITEYPIPTAGSGAQWLTLGPDNNLWFTEGNANNIGKVTTGSTTTCVAPAITTQPGGQTINSGQTTTLTVAATGTTPLTYQWYQGTSGDTSNPVGGSASTYTTPAITATTTYWVRITNTCGTANSQTATITITSTSTGAGALYHFDEGSGTVAIDSSGNGNNGTISGATYMPGYSGTALFFHAGGLDNVNVPLSVFKGFGTTAYFEAEIRPSVYPGTCNGNSALAMIFRKRDPNNEWYIFLKNDGSLSGALWDGPTRVGYGVTSPANVVTLNTWTKIGLLYDGTALQILANDTVVARQVAAITPNWTPQSSTMMTEIGNSTQDDYAGSACGDYSFGGDIDEVTISTTKGSTTTCTPPAITAQPQGSSINSGQSVILSVTATGTTPLTYQWYKGTSGDTSNPVGGSANTYTTPALTTTTTYWVQIKNVCGATTNSTTATITIQAVQPTPVFTADGIVNAASGQAGIVPGSLASIYGTNLAHGSSQAQSAPWPTNLGGTIVLVNGIAAPLSYAGNGQINFQVPWEASGGVNATIIVSNNGALSTAVNVPVLAVQPGIFVVNGRQAIAWDNKTGQLVSASNPARPGDVVTLYATGLGAVNPSSPTGTPASAIQLSWVTGTVTVTVAGTPAQVLFAGLTPGYIGLYQINVITPNTLTGKDLTITVNTSAASATMAAAENGAWIETFDVLDSTRWSTGNARKSVESRDSRVTHSTTPFSVWQALT